MLYNSDEENTHTVLLPFFFFFTKKLFLWENIHISKDDWIFFSGPMKQWKK